MLSHVMLSYMFKTIRDYKPVVLGHMQAQTLNILQFWINFLEPTNPPSSVYNHSYLTKRYCKLVHNIETSCAGKHWQAEGQLGRAHKCCWSMQTAAAAAAAAAAASKKSFWKSIKTAGTKYNLIPTYTGRKSIPHLVANLIVRCMVNLFSLASIPIENQNP